MLVKKTKKNDGGVVKKFETVPAKINLIQPNKEMPK